MDIFTIAFLCITVAIVIYCYRSWSKRWDKLTEAEKADEQMREAW